MKAIVMAGGKGTRLRPLTCKQPKPMVPIAGRPMMEYIIQLLKRNSFTNIGVTLFYLPEIISNYFGDGKDYGVSLRYFIEETPLGTAGSVKNAEDFLDETFLVISGDALTDINLQQALAFHRAQKALVTIVLTKVSNPLDYGVVITETNGKIKRFLEKPGWGEVFSDTVNTGIYLIEPEVFQFYEKDTAVDFSKDLFPRLLEAGQSLYGYVAEGYWSDVGNLNQYRQANYDLVTRKIDFTPPGQEIAPGIWAGEGTEIDQDSSLEAPLVLGKYVQIRKGVNLGKYSVLGDHILVNEQASIKRSILWNHVYIGFETELRGSILAHHSHLKSWVSTYEGAVIGEGCTVGSKSVINPEVKIWPEKYIESGSILNTSMVWGSRWGTNLFGNQGVDKAANIELTPEFAVKLGAAYGTVLPEKSWVVVSTDNFRPAKMLKTAMVCGFLGTGINVYDLGVMITPVTRHTVLHLPAKAGVHLRSSPQNHEHTLVEFYDEQGLTINRDLERKLEQAFFMEEFRRVPCEHLGKVTYAHHLFQHYLEEIMKVTDQQLLAEAGFKVIVNYNKETLSSLLPTLLTDLGCEVLSYQLEADHNFQPQTITETSSIIKELANQIKVKKADLGVVIDSNAECLRLLDEKGRLVKAEQFLALLSIFVLKHSLVDTIALPVTAPMFIEGVVKEHHGKLVRTKANSRAVMEKVVQEKIFSGKDGKIHFQPAFDALYSLVKTLELMAREKMSLSELVSVLPQYYMDQKAVDCPWEDKGRVMRSLFEENKENKIEVIDGLKVFHDQGWALVLPDAEAPVFQVYSEASSQEEANALTSLYTERIYNLQTK